MKSLLLGFFVVFTFCCFQAKATNPTLNAEHRNLFLEWKHEDSTVVLGHFSSSRLKRIATATMPIGKLTQRDVDAWLGNNEPAALLLFHCMWGQQPNFHKKKYLASIDNILDSTPRLRGAVEILPAPAPTRDQPRGTGLDLVARSELLMFQPCPSRSSPQANHAWPCCPSRHRWRPDRPRVFADREPQGRIAR